MNLGDILSAEEVPVILCIRLLPNCYINLISIQVFGYSIGEY